MNKIVGYRKMIGMSQEEIAKIFNISVQAYRNKEKGRVPFKQIEMKEFKNLLISKGLKNIKIDEIFFT
ncbi:helix-turn-helix domain-containing protein [Macrococcus sp. 18KM445]|uniref:helix-turn-helix domain-containing protein n=1 Tax=Macrococcus equi TaxID=3395462 RepID=UPI0039BDA565